MESSAFVANYYTRYLQEFCNKARQEEDYALLRDRLPQFFSAVCAAGSISTKVAYTSSYCVICMGLPDAEMALGCAKQHVACEKCLRSLVRNTCLYQEQACGNVECPQCKSYINEELCYYILGTIQEEMMSTVASVSDVPDEPQAQPVRRSISDIEPEKPGKPFTCPLCYCEGNSAQEITLDCQHMFHRECLKDQLDDCVKEQKVNDMNCMECNRAVSLKCLMKIDPARFEAYNEVASVKAITELASEGEQVS
jgi:hypothetical protein